MTQALVKARTGSRTILIVEDSDEDYEALVWAMRGNSAGLTTVRCKDGERALDCLEHWGHAAQYPAMMLLDLNLPRTNGYQVLQHIRTSEQLKLLPVVVLTTSASQVDVDFCYRNGASGYVLKPVSLMALRASVEGIITYWFDLVILPQLEVVSGS